MRKFLLLTAVMMMTGAANAAGINDLAAAAAQLDDKSAQPLPVPVKTGKSFRDILNDYETALLATKNFAKFRGNAADLNCEDKLNAWAGKWEQKVGNFLDKGSDFPGLSAKDRTSLVAKGAIPRTFGELRKKVSFFSPKNSALVMGIIARETGFNNPFLDERNFDSDSIDRQGAGLLQMTKWNDAKEAEWGPNDYKKYAGYRSKAGTSPGLRNVPQELRVETRKDQIRSAKDFLESPYNPVAALWYAQQDAVEHSIQGIRKTGIPFDSLSGSDRSSLIGAVYNGGAHRLRCAAERVRRLNGAEQQSRFPMDWPTLRVMLYLDSSLLQAAGADPKTVAALQGVCEGLAPAECRCLDQEEKGKSHTPQQGNDRKAAIMTSYGDELPKFARCF